MTHCLKKQNLQCNQISQEMHKTVQNRSQKVCQKTIITRKQKYCNDLLKNWGKMQNQLFFLQIIQVKLTQRSSIHQPLKILLISSRKLSKSIKQIISRIQKTKYKKINWGKQELIILIWVIEKYSKMNNTIPAQFNQNDWKFIASLVPEKDEQQCMFKWLSLSKNKSNQKFPWTSTEDQLLKILVIDDDENQKQKKWLDISKKLYLKNEGFKVYRTAKQCRQRWTCFLNPDLKKSLWTISEDTILIQNYLKIGKKWAFIAKLITGRTENAVKNRFNLILEKKKKIQYSCGYLSDQEFMKLHLKNIGCTEMLENQMKNSQTKMDPTYKPKYQSKKSNNQSLSSTKCKTIVQMSEYTVSQSRIEQPLVYKTISSKQNKILKNQLLDPYPLQKISSKQQLIDLDFKDQKGTLTNFNINNNFPKSIEFIEFNEQHMFKLYSFTSIGNFLTINNSINFLA